MIMKMITKWLEAVISELLYYYSGIDYLKLLEWFQQIPEAALHVDVNNVELNYRYELFIWTLASCLFSAIKVYV